MLVVHVFVHVKADQIEAFKQATVENATNSIKEPGIARFDVVQQNDDPTRFVLIEVYRTNDDPAKHKETANKLLNQAKQLNGYIGLYLEQEVKAEGLIRNLDSFSRFLEALSFSHGHCLNLSAVARECQVKRATVTNYVDIAQDLF